MGTVLALGCLALLLLLARGGEGEGNKVRLCGRDFIRAVVFTCGGSRWRRHQDLRGEYSPTPAPAPPKSLQLQSNHSMGCAHVPSPDPRASQGMGKQHILCSPKIPALLATSCCNVGCSRTEISSLC
uniref:Insulin-like domain-containing protein n=1 Tax=Taeniopygia guttata TaxID=59729 RepID=H0ZIR0_TAEGU